MTARLNLGCGLVTPDDWINVDGSVYSQHDGITGPYYPHKPAPATPSTLVFLHDLRESFAPENADFYDYAVCHHVLDMLTDTAVVTVLANVLAVLKPDGVLRVSTPDIVAGFRAWECGDRAWFPTRHASVDERFCTWLTWHGTRRSLWTFGRWSRGLYQAGFRDVRKCEFGLTKLCADVGICELDSRPSESLFLEAIK